MRCESCGADLGMKDQPVVLRGERLMVKCPACDAVTDLTESIKRLLDYQPNT